MVLYAIGSLTTVPVSDRADLVAPAVAATLGAAGLLGAVGVVEIDPALSDTAETERAYGAGLDQMANCVVVGGRRAGVEKIAACLVLASTRADVNDVVKHRLDVRKASFLPQDRAVDLTGMEYGGITPIGLPAEWPVYVDRRVTAAELVLIGSGVRRSKLVLPGELVAKIPGVEVVEGLGR